MGEARAAADTPAPTQAARVRGRVHGRTRRMAAREGRWRGNSRGGSEPTTADNKSWLAGSHAWCTGNGPGRRIGLALASTEHEMGHERQLEHPVDGRASPAKLVRQSRAGLPRRWHDRSSHWAALNDPGSPGHLAHIVDAVQGYTQLGARNRQTTERECRGRAR